MEREDRIIALMHRIADRMIDSLSDIFTSRGLLAMDDCDDVRLEYGRWFAEDETLLARYDRLDAMLHSTPTADD